MPASIPTVDAQSSTTPGPDESAPWWPNPSLQHSQFRDGWNLRIPLVVQDARPLLRQGVPVQVHVDLARSLVDNPNGWPGIDHVPRSFMSYPESVRLVEYTDDWNDIRGEVPFLLHTLWLEPDQLDSQYAKEQTGPYHGQRNPTITLEWLLPRDLSGGQPHYYFVYFDILQNAGEEARQAHEPYALKPADAESLDGLYWVGAGTTLYGYYPHSTTQPTMRVTAAQPGTTIVSVYTYQGTTARLDKRPGSNQVNPLTLTSAGATATYSFGLVPTHFRVESDKPVIVSTVSPQLPNGGAEFVPSREGSLLGWTFDVPFSASAILPPGTVAATLSSNGQVVCSLSQNPLVSFCPVGPAPTPLTTTGGPILIQAVPSVSSSAPAQVPSGKGSPVGSTFNAFTISSAPCPGWNPPGFASGGLDVGAWYKTAYVDVRDRTVGNGPRLFAGAEVVPPGSVHFQGNQMQPTICPPPPPNNNGVSPQWQSNRPYSAEAVPDSAGEPTGPIQVQAGYFGSSPVRQNTPFGGRHGVEFQVAGPFVAYNYYPATHITATFHSEQGRTETRTAGPIGVPMAYNVGKDAVTTLTSDKPLSVFPFGTPTNYFRFHAAKPEFLVPQILPGQFRGYLFDVQPEGKVDPVFLTALPGEPRNVTFQVRNLARWAGEPLQDTLRFSAAVESRNWDGYASVGVTFDQKRMLLPDAETRANRVKLELPSDIPTDTQLTIRVRAMSDGNPQMFQDFSIVVLVRQTFDVELWFGEPTSISGPRQLPLRIEPGADRAIPFVLRNKGSGPDSFDLTFGPPGGGWAAHMTDAAGRPLSRIPRLEPEQQAGGILHLKAPLTQELAAVTIPIDAISATSPLASDRIILEASLALAQDLELSAESLTEGIRPGATRRYNVTLHNTGEDGLSIRLGIDANLPPAWTAEFAGLGAPSQPPLSLRPGQTVTIPIDLRAPSTAGANQFVSFLLHAEGLGDGVDARDAISLSATVDRSQLLAVVAPKTLVLKPGIPTTFDVKVTNHGNGPDLVRIEPGAIPSGWRVSGLNRSSLINIGQNASLTLQVEAPPQEPPASIDLSFLVRGDGALLPFALTTQIEAIHDVVWSNATRLLGQPGDHLGALLRLENRGNVLEHLTVRATGPWPASVRASALQIVPGGVRTVLLEIDVPESVAPGEESVVLVAGLESGTGASLSLPIQIEIPRLEAEEVILSTQPQGRGSIGTVLAVMHNPGVVPVHDAIVRLALTKPDGAVIVVDNVYFESIGPNGTVVAPLRWVAGEHPRPDRVEWGQMRGGAFLPLGNAPIEAFDAKPTKASKTPMPDTTAIIALLVAMAAFSARRGGRA